MPFPFSMHFSKPLKAVITPENRQMVLNYIKQSITDKKADNVVINLDHVKYKGSTSNSRTSLFGTVDCGVFSVILENGRWYVSYQIFIKKLFLFASAFCTLGAFITNIWFGVIGFLWLFGLNCLVALFQDMSSAGTLMLGIDELICGKEPEVYEVKDEDSEKLKSWF
ncbi:hypothetical protein [Mucilaginibacter sp. CSA2-8R]|uniref:hypothetical protein n=1 Tax=Mucilaginibacter sp. CSA2-8R TaxID=3141542 RepID=UPI00315C5171